MGAGICCQYAEQSRITHTLAPFTGTADRQLFLLHGSVSYTPLKNLYGYSSLLQVDSMIRVDNNQIVMTDKSVFCKSSKMLPPCGRVTLAGTFRAPMQPSAEDTFNELAYCRSQNVWGTFTSRRLISYTTNPGNFQQFVLWIRSTLFRGFDALKNNDYRAIVVASILGEKNYMSADVKQLFINSGIYHLIALSGFNVAIVIVPLELMLLFLPLGRTIKLCLMISVLWGYLGLTGFNPSLFRAVMMATLFLLTYIVQRKSSGLNTLGFAGLCWLLYSPSSLFSPSFQLSFCATFGLLTLYPLFNFSEIGKTAPLLLKKSIQYVMMPAAITIAATISTLPVSIYHFDQFSVFGLFANLFAVTLMSWSLWTFLVGVCALPILPSVAHWIFAACEFCMGLIFTIAGWSQNFSFSTIRVHINNPLLYGLYILFFLILITLGKGFRKNFLIWAAPVVLGIVSAILLIERI